MKFETKLLNYKSHRFSLVHECLTVFLCQKISSHPNNYLLINITVFIHSSRRSTISYRLPRGSESPFSCMDTATLDAEKCCVSANEPEAPQIPTNITHQFEAPRTLRVRWNQPEGATVRYFWALYVDKINMFFPSTFRVLYAKCKFLMVQVKALADICQEMQSVNFK